MTSASTIGMLRPAASATRDYHFPRFHHSAFDNGLTLVSAAIPRVPLVSIIALVDAGATSEPSGAEGIGHLVAKLLLQGTAAGEDGTLAERFEHLGARVDAAASWDRAAIRTTVLAPHLRRALSLLASSLRQPRFEHREVERLKAERSAEILQLRSEPRGLADQLFERALYSSASRYGQPELGGLKSIETISLDDVEAFHGRRYVPDRVTVIIVGDIVPDQVETLVSEAFADWTGSAPPSPHHDDRSTDAGRRVRIVNRPAAPQSELRAGHVGLPRNHPDHFAVVVMNAILGGLFSSRINLNLREVHGYTYGAHSGFGWRSEAGPFMISTAVQTDVSVAALGEIINEFERICAAPVAKEELVLATSYLDGVFPIRYETTAEIAIALAAHQTYRLPADYFDNYRSKIREVTAEAVLGAARSHLHPERLQLLVVGDAEKVRPGLEALKFGPVSMHDVDLEPIST